MSTRKRLVVVGGVAAGMSAASKARRIDPGLEVVVYEKSGFVSYGACGLPYYIQGIIDDHSTLIARTPVQFARQGIEVHLHHEVMEIDPEGRRVRVRDLEAGREFEVEYDRLVLTTGGNAVRPPFPGIDREGVFTLRRVEDGIALRRFIEEKSPERAVIVGGGYIGLEMAEAFRSRGLEVTVVEMLPQLVPNLDAEMASLVREELERNGVRVLLEHRVEEIGGDERVEAVIASGVEVPADLVLVAVGVRPNVDLARRAGIDLGPTGAVAVDDHQRTNLEGVFAAGDVAEARHIVTGKPVYIPLGTTANKQGRVAGENVAGGDAVFHGVAGTAVAKVFGLEVARTGLTERQAREEGFEPLSTTVKAASQAHYYPGGGPLHVRLVFRKDGHLLGAQMVGKGAAKRIDVVAAALQAGWGIRDLQRLDLSYAPPFAPVWDPILVAANVAEKAVR